MARHIPLLLLCTALAAGCTLIDQTTFNPRAGLGPVEPVSTGPGAPPPLIAIDFDKPDPVYEAQLRQAVDQALAVKPTVSAEVVTVVPATGTPEQQVDAAVGIRADARDVARIIADQGIDPDRIHMSAHSDQGATGRQVLVFVH